MEVEYHGATLHQCGLINHRPLGHDGWRGRFVCLHHCAPRVSGNESDGVLVGVPVAFHERVKFLITFLICTSLNRADFTQRCHGFGGGVSLKMERTAAVFSVLRYCLIKAAWISAWKDLFAIVLSQFRLLTSFFQPVIFQAEILIMRTEGKKNNKKLPQEFHYHLM